MAIPKRYEQHVVACALCGEVRRFGTLREMSIFLQSHSQRKHLKSSAYIKDAVRTVTVMYETRNPDAVKEQLPEHLDPSTAFFLAYTNDEISLQEE